MCPYFHMYLATGMELTILSQKCCQIANRKKAYGGVLV